MHVESPETLLTSALEKILYFEARAGQLQRDATAAREEANRLQRELREGGEREVALRRQVAELEVRLAAAQADHEAAQNVNRALRADQQQLLGSVLDAARLQAEQAGEGLDLARFIATLRAEVLARRTPAALVAATATPPSAPTRAEPLAAQAPVAPGSLVDEMQAGGRLALTSADADELLRGSGDATPADRARAALAMEDLASPVAATRERAATRLAALAQRASAPALAHALRLEADPDTASAMLCALGAVGGGEALALVLPYLQSQQAALRIAALKATLKLDPSSAGPRLAAAIEDPDPRVRRRASLLALSLDPKAAVALGSAALKDKVPSVRAVAVMVLGASVTREARAQLTCALDDPDPRVRGGASRALSAALGRDVSGLAALDDAQRRRHLRRVLSGASLPRAAPPPATSAPRPAAPRPSVARARPAAPPPAAPRRGAASAAVATLQAAPPPAAAAVGGTAKAAILNHLRASLRGATLADLVGTLDGDGVAAFAATDALVREGAAVRRGVKYFAA